MQIVEGQIAITALINRLNLSLGWPYGSICKKDPLEFLHDHDHDVDHHTLC